MRPFTGLLLLLLLLGACAPKQVAPPHAPDAILPSATLLTYAASVGPVGAWVDGIHVTFCTATAINQARHYWLTAAHCVADPEMAYTVSEAPAHVIVRDVLNDLAILEVPDLDVPGRPLAARPPVVGQVSLLIGYQGLTSMQDRVVTFGWIAHPSLVCFPDGPVPWNKPFTLVQIVGAPGNSGSAVLNSLGEIVGVAQGSWTRGWGPMLLSATLASLEPLRIYWPTPAAG